MLFYGITVSDKNTSFINGRYIFYKKKSQFNQIHSEGIYNIKK